MFICLSPGGTGGGQTVTLTGQGFSEDLTATICGDYCVLKQTTSSEYVCKTPAKSGKLSRFYTDGIFQLSYTRKLGWFIIHF